MPRMCFVNVGSASRRSSSAAVPFASLSLLGSWFRDQPPIRIKRPRCCCAPPQPRTIPLLRHVLRAHAGSDDNCGERRLPSDSLGSDDSPGHGPGPPCATKPEDLPVVTPVVLEEQDVRRYDSDRHRRHHQDFQRRVSLGSVQEPERTETHRYPSHGQCPVQRPPGDAEESANRPGRPRASGPASSPEGELGPATAGPGYTVRQQHHQQQHQSQQQQQWPQQQLAARWPALVLLPAAVWGASWASTLGVLSGGYAALAFAAAIAAAAFCSLAPDAAAAASGAGGNAAAATAAAVAAVDWVDVALRTAEGFSANGGAARAQVMAALQDAGTGSWGVWAVTAVLPGLCSVAGSCRAAATAVRTGLPWLEPLAQLAAAAAGLGVLLVLALPLRRYVAPLLPVLPREGPSDATWVALRAGGVACMVAVLTTLQLQEVAAPPMAPSSRGTLAAAALASPLLRQGQAVLYGLAAALSDAALPMCTAVVAARVMHELVRGLGAETVATQQPLQRDSGAQAPSGTRAGSDIPTAGTITLSAEADGHAAEPATVPGRRWSEAIGAVRALAAGRLLLDIALLVGAATGALPGKISAVRLLGMLWLLQTAVKL